MEAMPLDFQNKSLQQQGFREYTNNELMELRWGLRFTPGVCMALAIFGLITQNANILFALAALGMLPIFFPAAHPFDVLYNHVLRPLWQGVRLPPNPLPRRIACFSGGVMNLVVALAFSNGMLPLAYVTGGALIVLQLIVITTHFCVASWMYEGVMRLLGMWEEPVAPEKIRELKANGALVVDVREPYEYSEGHLDQATNLPLSQLAERLNLLKGHQVLLYCQSGIRSMRAANMLKAAGHTECHNLGDMERARRFLRTTGS